MNGPLSRRRLGLGAAFIGLFVLMTLVVVAGWTQALDDAWNRTMVSAEVDWLVSVAEVFHIVGSVTVALTLGIGVCVGFLVAKRWNLAVGWVLILGATQILTTVFKITVDRSRPIDTLVHEPSAAFPSGHASVSGAAMAVGLAILLGFIWPNRLTIFLWIGIVYAVLMALSRTYLRVHWLTDVAGGLVLGTAMVLLVAAFLLARGSGKALAMETT